MAKEASFGIIPLRRGDLGWEVCVVKHCSGHWSFPKGHSEKKESPLQTATRELKEETNLDVIKLLSEEILEEKYVYRYKGEIRDKTVTYFLAEVSGELKILPKEIHEAKWLLVDEAVTQVTFPQARAICKSLLEKISKS